MAKKKAAENKIVLERTFNVPLRKEFQKVSQFRRAKRAMSALKAFLVKHMKSDEVAIGRHANMEIWKNGIKNPPHHIKIVAKKDEKGKVTAELEGAKPDAPIVPVSKKSKATTTQEKIKEAVENLKEAKEDKAEEKTSVEQVQENKSEKLEDTLAKEAPAQKESKPTPKKEEVKEAPKAAEKKAETKPAEKKEAPKAESKPAEKKE